MIPHARNSSRIMMVLACGLIANMPGLAQTDTMTIVPVQTEHTSMFAVGHADLLDTYLSQETFTGTELRYLSRTARLKPSRHLTRETMHQIWVSSAGTRSNRNSLLTVMYNLRMGWYYDSHISPSLSVSVGAMANGALGGTYCTRNSNNPAQARVSLSVDPACRISWIFHWGRHSLSLHYAAAVPLAGVAFSPNYGQSYYEIFSQGNYDHNVVLTSIIAAPQLMHMLTLDFTLWKQRLSIGYLGDMRQTSVNHLKYHAYTHAIAVGWHY